MQIGVLVHDEPRKLLVGHIKRAHVSLSVSCAVAVKVTLLPSLVGVVLSDESAAVGVIEGLVFRIVTVAELKSE